MARNQSLTQEEFLERAFNIHGDMYDYSETKYINKRSKVIIKCKKHGNFEQYPSNHLSGSGCEKCSKEKKLLKGKKPRKFNFPVLKSGQKLSQKDCIERFKIVHGDKFDYSLVKYVKNDIEVLIICKEHGQFYQKPSIHWSGSDCPRCNNYTITQEDCIERFIEVHGNKYDYSLVEYIKNDLPVTIICKDHGPFEKSPILHWGGSGCPKCSKNNISKIEIMKRLNDINPYQHSFEFVNYISMHEKVTIVCKEHGPFERTLANYFTNYQCPKCTGKSKYELEIEEIYKAKNINFIFNDRKLIGPLEIDLLNTEYKFGIEFNGMIYHSYGKSEFKMFDNLSLFDKNKHLNKTNLVEKKNFQLFHIKEIDWNNPIKKEIWLSIINNKIGFSQKLFARKLKIIDLTNQYIFVKNFLNNNHLQGFCNYKYAYGLYNNKNEVYSIITFGKSRFRDEDGVELLRFCNAKNFQVIGGASKLLKHFERIHKPQSIVSYAKRDWSQGNLYKQLGFEFVSYTEPSKFWYDPINIKLYSRQKFQKHKLKDLFLAGVLKTLNGINTNDILYNNGLRAYFDSGNIKFKKEYNEL